MDVSIVTRTRNRPLLLPRALDSLSNQTARNFEWIIVNDGGEKTAVDRIATDAMNSGLDTRVIHRQTSTGMEAASNAGVAAATKPWILIHDDDDSLLPAFLERTTAFLAQNDHYVGVVTHANRVIEKIEGDQVHTVSTEVLNPRLESVDLALLAVRNQFPPISLVFSREAYDAIGGFDESLPVLGDWDFNLKLVMHGDIGLVPEALANHHHRLETGPDGDSYSNTVTAGHNTHLAWESRYRNHALRRDLAAGKAGLGHILSQGKQMEILYRELEHLRVAGDGWNVLMRLSLKTGLHRLLKRLSRSQPDKA